MMRILVIILLAFATAITKAQPLSVPQFKRSDMSIYFLLSGGLLTNLNDKDGEQPVTGFLKVNNTTGYRAGLEFIFIPRRKVPVFLNAGLEYRHVPHRYTLQYGSTSSGLSTNLITDIKFVVHSVALRIAPVYAIPLSENNYIDVSAGAMFDVAVLANDGYAEEGLYVQDGKTGYNQLAVYRYTGHGAYAEKTSVHGTADFGLNFMYYGSVSYRMTPRFMGKRMIRIGAEYGKIAKGNRVSQTTVLYMDNNRNIKARDQVSDKGANIAVFIMVSI